MGFGVRGRVMLRLRVGIGVRVAHERLRLRREPGGTVEPRTPIQGVDANWVASSVDFAAHLVSTLVR